MAPTLTDTTAECASNDVDRLITTQYGCWHKACQRTNEDDGKDEARNRHKASVLQQIQRAVGHLHSLILQGEGYQIGNDKSNRRKEDALSHQFGKHLQARQSQESPCGHLLRTVCCQRDAQVHVVEDGEHKH